MGAETLRRSGVSLLVRLFGENYRSFRHGFELSMVAADLPSERDRGTVELSVKGMDRPLVVLRAVAIYGANASGKSTVLNAARALRWMIRESSRSLEPDQTVWTYEPFALSKESRSLPLKLGATVWHERVLYEYTVTFDHSSVHNERLIRLDRPDEPTLQRSETGEVSGIVLEKLPSLRELLKKPRANTPVFSFLAQHGPESGDGSVRDLWGVFCDRLRFADYSASFPGLKDPTAKRMFEDESFRQWALANLIMPADLGISDVKVETRDLPDFFDAAPEVVRKQVSKEAPFHVPLFTHVGDPSFPLLFQQESAGTQKMYGLARDWWSLGHRKQSLFADELSASLHPTLLDQLVRAANDTQRTRQSQLIFATHDTGLLERRDGSPAALRRDQVYFVEKKRDGRSELYSLAEYKDDARPVHNIRRRYLQDRYGAIPHVEGLSL